MARTRTVYIHCSCGRLHAIKDPRRNVKLRCKESNALLIYECRMGDRYRLRGPGRDFFLDQELVAIGRHPDNDIVLDSSELSRHHCALHLGEDGYAVEDLGSRNGTYVNEEKLPPQVRHKLTAGDLIRLSDTVMFRYIAPDDSEGEDASLAGLSAAGLVEENENLRQTTDDEWIGRTMHQYEIVSLIGQGGMGRVYKAADTQTGKPCVIKTIIPDVSASETALRRFLREIDLNTRVRHPNIVGYLGTGQAKNVLYIAMEYFDGKNLRECHRNRRATPKGAVVIGRQIAGALHAAHEAGIVHRDIKPENILLNDVAEVKVIDFGVAKAFAESEEEQLTVSGAVVGTPHYMAPEQFSNSRDVGPLADIYALGGVLYFSLTRHPPRSGKNVVEVFRSIKKPMKLIGEYRDDVPAELEALLMQALAVAPEDRPQSAKAFEDALAAVPLG